MRLRPIQLSPQPMTRPSAAFVEACLRASLGASRAIGASLPAPLALPAYLGASLAAGTSALFAAALILSACSGAPQGAAPTGSPAAGGAPGALEAVPVTVGSVVQKEVPVEVRAIGTVEAFSTVEFRTQIGGELTQVAFREGQDIRKGDLLFQIDPRSYQAALDQAQAALERDTVQLKNAQADVARYKDLVKKDFVTQEQYDRILANAAALDAVVSADKAAVENARIQLGYCTIRSPVNGRAGRLMVHQGNVVKANDASLVVINQISPINVAFSVPQQRLPEIKKFMAGGALKVEAAAPGAAGAQAAAAPAEAGAQAAAPAPGAAGGPGASSASGTADAAEGELTFVDNAVDRKTGTILLKGTFANEDRSLWPGLFVEVKLRLTTQPDALTVPSQAVQTGQQGPYVFVVRPDSTVESRPVETAGTYEQDTIIAKGLKAGEKVVTDGQLRLVPGAKVEIKGEALAQGAAS